MDEVLDVSRVVTSYYCTECDATFIKLKEYKDHMTIHTTVRPDLKCNICNATFKRRDHLRRHETNVHSNNFTCPLCGEKFGKHDTLLLHVEGKHASNSAMFRCRHCPIECNGLAELIKHEFWHSESERHACSHCGATFKRKDHMVRHVKCQHLNEHVTCPLCGQIYKRKDHLARHIREKHRNHYSSEVKSSIPSTSQVVVLKL